MIIFASMNTRWCEQMWDLCRDISGVRVMEGDVRDISKENALFVSPANSLGFMDGGFDLALSRDMFPGIQRRVQDTIRSVGLQTALGRYYLPVGSAVFIPVVEEQSGLIVTPTMFLPHNVSQTQNAYWSAMAALMMHRKQCAISGVQYHLVITSHCCGYGGMPVEESVQQMFQAYTDFCAGNIPPILRDDTNVLLLPDHDNEQPDNYDNREIKELTVTTSDYIQKILNRRS
jgi:O-acetyl-ADP-ribose deacetylase (regulator of RNase III)